MASAVGPKSNNSLWASLVALVFVVLLGCTLFRYRDNLDFLEVIAEPRNGSKVEVYSNSQQRDPLTTSVHTHSELSSTIILQSDAVAQSEVLTSVVNPSVETKATSRTTTSHETETVDFDVVTSANSGQITTTSVVATHEGFPEKSHPATTAQETQSDVHTHSYVVGTSVEKIITSETIAPRVTESVDLDVATRTGLITTTSAVATHEGSPEKSYSANAAQETTATPQYIVVDTHSNETVQLPIGFGSDTSGSSKPKVSAADPEGPYQIDTETDQFIYAEDNLKAMQLSTCTFGLPMGAVTSPTTQNTSILSSFYNTSILQWNERVGLPTCNATHPTTPGAWAAACRDCDDMSTCVSTTWTWLREACTDRNMVQMWRRGPLIDSQISDYLTTHTTVFMGDSTLRELFLRMLVPLLPAHPILQIHNRYRHDYFGYNQRNRRVYWNYLVKPHITQEALVRKTLLEHMPRSHLQDRPVVIVIGGTSTYVDATRLVLDGCNNNNATNQTWLAENCPWKPEVGGKGIRVIVKSTGSIKEKNCCAPKGYDDIKTCPMDPQQVCAQQLSQQLVTEQETNERMGDNQYDWLDVFNVTASMRSMIADGDENACSCHYGHEFIQKAYGTGRRKIVWPWSGSRMLDSLANMLAIKLTANVE